MAEFSGEELIFNPDVWRELESLYHSRGLPLREAHRRQCYFPASAETLKNPVGTALGFRQRVSHQTFFVLPGPPRELQGMWDHVAAHVKHLNQGTAMEWVRWTCLGVPESEVAEVVEAEVKGLCLEVGYRAQVPYVKVKIFADPTTHAEMLTNVDRALTPWTVARGSEDPVDLFVQAFLQMCPRERLVVIDEVTNQYLAFRLFECGRAPRIEFHNVGEWRTGDVGLEVRADQEDLAFTLHLRGDSHRQVKRLPYGVKLASERGKRSAAEWVICGALSELKAQCFQT